MLLDELQITNQMTTVTLESGEASYVDSAKKEEISNLRKRFRSSPVVSSLCPELPGSVPSLDDEAKKPVTLIKLATKNKVLKRYSNINLTSRVSLRDFFYRKLAERRNSLHEIIEDFIETAVLSEEITKSEKLVLKKLAVISELKIAHMINYAL